MNSPHPLESIPLWLMFIAMLAVLLSCIVIGILLARSRRKRLGNEDREPVNTLVGATLGLLAFILGFTFGLTSSRFDARKELLLEEVNAIETTFLRAGLIPDPYSAEVRSLLREYVDLRVELTAHPGNLTELIKDSERLQGLLWQQATALSKEELKNVAMARLFINSLNEMIDLQTKRVTVALVYRIPLMISISLFILTLLSMFAVGYLIGLSPKANWTLILVLAFSFSIVIALIADLDRSGTGRTGIGIIQVSQQPMIDLQRRINAPAH